MKQELTDAACILAALNQTQATGPVAIAWEDSEGKTVMCNIPRHSARQLLASKDAGALLIESLKTANSMAEEFERKWHLRGDEVESKDAEIAALKEEEIRILAASRYSADLCTQALDTVREQEAEIAALKARLEITPGCAYDGIDTRSLTIKHMDLELDAKIAEIAALRKDAYDICMSRSLSLSRDGKHAEANEASKCASAVKYAKLDAAIAQAVQPRPLTAAEHGVMQAAIADGLEIVHGGQAMQPAKENP